MGEGSERLVFAVIVINVTLGAFLNFLTYDFVGVGIFIFNIIMVTFLTETRFAGWIINHEIKSCNMDFIYSEKYIRLVLLVGKKRRRFFEL